ncbi:MAG: hypothetical protein ACTSQY_06125 [Candidatus Odinarchaeia archaeon]
MSVLSDEELKKKSRLTGILGFTQIVLILIAGFTLGYPYVSLMDYATGIPKDPNTLLVITGLMLYLVSLGIAVYSFYVDRTPFDIDHPVRRRHSSLPVFFIWLLLWNTVLYFIVGLFARVHIDYASYWAGTINDFVMRYVIMLGTVLMIMMIILTWLYNKIIPDREILTKEQFKRKLIFVGIAWAAVIIVFTVVIYMWIPVLPSLAP